MIDQLDKVAMKMDTKAKDLASGVTEKVIETGFDAVKTGINGVFYAVLFKTVLFITVTVGLVSGMVFGIASLF